MKTALSRRNFVRALGAAGAAVGGAAVLAPLRAQERNPWPLDGDAVLDRGLAVPDPQHIKERGRGWTVTPTGIDDHANLEWALRHTLPGGTVRLVGGTYKLSTTVIVANFNGSLVGSGAANTTVTCTDEFSYEIWEAPGGGKDRGAPRPPPFPRARIDGSSTFAAPGYFMMYKTPLGPGESASDRANRIEVKNMRFRGACLGAPWTFGDEIISLNIVNSMDWHNPESAPATTRQDVLLSGLEVDGYVSPEFGPSESGCACITVLGGMILTANYDLEGSVDGDAFGAANGGMLGITPADGNVAFSACTFRNCRLGPGVVAHQNSTLVFDGITTDGCSGNCLQLIDNSNCRIKVSNCALFCDSFLLPPERAGGATDVPSSLGCVVGFQGMTGALGIPNNLRFLSLAFDAEAHAAHPEAGPLGTWRPLGPSLAPAPSQIEIRDNACRSSKTINTYCFHVIDLANLAFGLPSVDVTIRGNHCQDSQTCISLEHIVSGKVSSNDCSSRAFGVELYDSETVTISGNSFEFDTGGCEIRLLQLGDKLDFSRVSPGAGSCTFQS